MSKKSTPGDGTHGKGVKGGGLQAAMDQRPVPRVLDQLLGLPGGRRPCQPRVGRPEMRAAVGLAPPALHGEFSPSDRSPVAPGLLGRRGDVDVADLSAALTATVDDLLEGVDTAAVALSGGIDSLAVAAAVVRTGRGCVALTADLVGDDGVSAAERAARLLAGTELDANWQRVAVDPDHGDGQIGGRMDHSAIPAARRALNRAAAAAGAEVLLSGDGADALLAAPPLLHDPSWRSAAGCPLDSRRGRRLAVGWLAAGWAEMFDPTPYQLLTAEAADLADRWTLAWLRDQLELAADLGWDLLTFDAWLQTVGLTPLPAAGPIPEPSVFFHPTMRTAALSLPIEDRHSLAASTAYRAGKQALMALVPPHMHASLPTAKQTFHERIIDELTAEAHRPPLQLIDAGVVDAAGWRAITGTAAGDWRAAVAAATASRYNDRLVAATQIGQGVGSVLAA